MRIISTIESIGKTYRKENWDSCYFEVQDVGFISCWGRIKDRKTKQTRDVKYYLLTEEWDEYDSVKEFIDSL